MKKTIIFNLLMILFNFSFNSFTDAAVTGFLPGLEDPMSKLATVIQAEDLCK